MKNIASRNFIFFPDYERELFRVKPWVTGLVALVSFGLSRARHSQLEPTDQSVFRVMAVRAILLQPGNRPHPT